MNHDTHEERDNLWKLLGRVRARKASPAFTRNVLRRVRMEAPVPERGFIEWLRTGWNWLPLSGAAAAVAIVLFATHSGSPETSRLATAARATKAPPVTIDEVVRSADFAVIANLDVLMAMDENEVWLEASLR
jgi:hypothetical protein